MDVQRATFDLWVSLANRLSIEDEIPTHISTANIDTTALGTVICSLIRQSRGAFSEWTTALSRAKARDCPC